MSSSGETDEMLNLLPHLRRLQTTLIAMTAGTDSLLARNADIILDVRVEREACPLNLAPTSSSTVMLVLGRRTRDGFAGGARIQAGRLRKAASGWLARARFANESHRYHANAANVSLSFPRQRPSWTLVFRTNDEVPLRLRHRGGSRRPAGWNLYSGRTSRALMSATPDIAALPVSRFMIRKPVTILRPTASQRKF